MTGVTAVFLSRVESGLFCHGKKKTTLRSVEGLYKPFFSATLSKIFSSSLSCFSLAVSFRAERKTKMLCVISMVKFRHICRRRFSVEQVLSGNIF